MATTAAQPVTITVNDATRVSGLVEQPHGATACLVLGHGAGAGMTHPFMAALAADLAGAGIATLRYQFPYMERAGRRPDPPALCQATVRAAVLAAHRLMPRLPLLAGGKSFGGRMTSQAQAAAPLPGVQGLVFFGFPLHPPNRPALTRAAHLDSIEVPMLFLQGTRDAFAENALLHRLLTHLGPRATWSPIEGADHAFHVPARSGRTDTDVRREMLERIGAWRLSLQDRSGGQMP